MSRPDGNGGLSMIGTEAFNNATRNLRPTIVAAPPALKTPLPLGEARVGYTADDPRTMQPAKKTGDASTIIRSTLG